MKIAFGYGSDARVRGENQDAFGVFEAGDVTLGIVCDGVGGHSGGQQAAMLAVRTVAQSLSDGARDLQGALVEAITLANRTIYETGRKSHRLMGMSTTIVAVAIREDMAVVAHVGDSRAYLVRNGVAKPLTRDHTMVNMFVDNDLLSAEDAASHPEAHVLARSLGSERQVDIDVQPGIQLQDGDYIVLCSDGVHGTLRDDDLAADWTRPGLTARQLLRKVAAQGGNDNASIVGFRIGGRGEPGMAFTPLPNVEQSGDMLTPSSSDMVHAPNLLEEPMPPALYPIEPEDEPTYHPDDHTSSIGGVPIIPPQQRNATPRPVPRTPAPVPSRPESKSKPKKKRKISPVVLIAGGASAFCLLILGAAAGYRFLVAPQLTGVAEVAPTDTDTLAAAAPPPVDPVPVDTDPIVPAGSVTPRNPDEPPVDDAGDLTRLTDHVVEGGISHAPPAGTWVYIEFPPKPAPKQTGASDYIHPRFRKQILEEMHQEGGSCEKVEAVVTEALDDSASGKMLYEDLWHCFDELRHDELEGSLSTYYEFNTVREAFEGNPEPPKDKKLPYWYLDATDGIERRMDLYAEHALSDPDSRREQFDDIVLQQVGRDLVAASFSYDLMTEAAYARAFSRLKSPNPGEVQAWARRVYNVRKHRTSKVGKLADMVYPEAQRQTAALLREATNDFEERFEDARAIWTRETGRDASDFDWQTFAEQERLPQPVAQALLVGAGLIEPPNAVKPEKKVSKGPPRPRDPSDLIPRDN